MSIIATFTGENEAGFVELWGKRFWTGQPVEVTGPHAIGKLRGNPEFTVEEGEAPVVKPKPARRPRRTRKPASKG